MENKDPNILIAVGDKYSIQVCDVKCYEALEPICDCVCGGRNHGIGLQQAIRLTVEKKDMYQRLYGKKVSYGEIVMKKIMAFT